MVSQKSAPSHKLSWLVFAPARRWERRGRAEHAGKEPWGRKERLVMLQLGDKNMCGEEGEVGLMI